MFVGNKKASHISTKFRKGFYVLATNELVLAHSFYQYCSKKQTKIACLFPSLQRMEFGTVEKLGIAVDASLAILFRPIFTEKREVIASLHGVLLTFYLKIQIVTTGSRKQSSTKDTLRLFL